MRVTFHNARVGGGKHNDRQFDLEKASHIDVTKTNKNLYINALNDKDLSFQESELKYYQYMFDSFIKDKNDRAIKSRHSERCVTAEDLLKSPKYRPEEVIFQIGDRNTHITEKQLREVFGRFLKWHQEKFQGHVETLNIAFHFDEKTPHVHWRKVYMYDDEKGFKSIGQHKALEQVGYKLPDENKQRSRSNNLKMVYSKECREKLFEICRDLEIVVEEKPHHRAPNKQNLDKGDFIIQQQDAVLERQRIDYQELENKKDLLKKSVNEVTDSLEQQQNEYNQLIQENQRLDADNSIKQEELKKYRDKLLQVAFYEKNKLKIDVINKAFTEKVEVKTFLNSKTVKVEKSDLIPLLAISKEIDERINNIEEREKQLNLKEKSINKQSEMIIEDARHQAKSIIENASTKSLSLDDTVKLAKYQNLVGDAELQRLEREEKQKNRSKNKTRSIEFERDR